MKKILLLLLISWSSFGQSDSLLILIKKHPQKDTVLINLLHDFVEVESDATIWTKYNLELKNILLEIISESKSQQKSKNWYIEKLVTCLLYEGQNYYQVSANTSRALNCFYEMIKYSQSINYKKGLAAAYNEIGVLKSKQKEYLEAINYMTKYSRICKEINDESNLSIGLNNIAYCYYLSKNNNKALEYFKQSYELKKKLKEPSIVITLGNIGNIYIVEKDYKKALDYYNQSLDLLQKNGKSVFGKYEDQLTVCLTAIARINYEQKKYDVALNYANRSMKVAQKTKKKQYVQKTFEVFYLIYEKIKQPQKALEAYKQFIILRDSTTNEESKSEILKAEFKYETELKEAQIKSLSQQKQISELESTRKTTLIYSILGAILALSAIAYFSFTRFKEKKANELLSTQLQEAERRIEIEQKATESELKALKSQMNPHFMFNALNSIQEQFMYGDKVQANEQMGNFTYLTRQILTVSGKKKINLSTEVEILTKYLELEKMRFAEGFEYDISLGENIDEDYHQIPPMLIQPFVENSIKHGLLHKQGEKKVKVFFELDEAEENLICVVEDNGVGREKSAEIKSKRVQQHESFSTSATEERLKLLSNGLTNKDLVVYEDLKNEQGEVIGTRVRIMITLG
ncbi:MAG: tetratricopeptide repeat protein [Arcicella sp.]|jgi:sensor histidine kinase YesM|nr:tetratricopeptide repeat protein [Arcicella sp.]